MRKMNDLSFVLALAGRSSIRLAETDDLADPILVDAALLEDVDALLLAERMLGTVLWPADEAVVATIH